ncbi:histidine triad nucleotide-binding protein [Kiloniella sp. b19]|uniref:histidine triad nucleotide-binding protein n=1 Tax=Kiloniella sp. GXU_MW_B19 TaxID=3141326 RepID=UPI0031E2EAEE
MAYDSDNIFAKILRSEIPAGTVFENDHVLAFRDIAPKAPVHLLIIPKGAYTDFADFSARASDAEIVAFNRAVGEIATRHKLDETGYRLIANIREDGCQEVPHYHVHLLGGENLGSPFKN